MASAVAIAVRTFFAVGTALVPPRCPPCRLPAR